MTIKVNNTKSFTAAEVLPQYRLVKMHSVAGQVVFADAGEEAIGALVDSAPAIGDVVSVAVTPGDIVELEASDVIALNAEVMAAADGKIVTATAASTALPSTGARINVYGKAMQAAGAAGVIIEVMYSPKERI